MLLNQGYVPCNKQIHIKIPENELQIYIGNMPVTLVYSYEKFGDRLKDYYHHQWGQDKVNAAVEEVIYKLVNNPKFQDALKNKVGAKTDTEELEKERDICRTKLRQAIGAKNRAVILNRGRTV